MQALDATAVTCTADLAAGTLIYTIHCRSGEVIQFELDYSASATLKANIEYNFQNAINLSCARSADPLARTQAGGR